MITVEDTGKKFRIKDRGNIVLEVRYRIKGQKKQVIFRRLYGDAKRFKDGNDEIMELLADKGVSKAYISVPLSDGSDYYQRCFVDCGFGLETKLPDCFIASNGVTKNGVDLAYYISKERRATLDELESIDSMLKEVDSRYVDNNVSVIDLKEISAPDGYKIRYVRGGDIPGICQLGKNVFVVNDDNTFESEAFVLYALSDEDTKMIVCEKEGKIVGVASAYLDNPKDPGTRIREWKTRMCEIADLVVSQEGEHKGKGIGKAMVGKLSFDVITKHNQVPYGYCYYNKEGDKEWGLEAQHLFASLGFKHVGIAHKVNNIAANGESNTGFKNNIVWMYPLKR